MNRYQLRKARAIAAVLLIGACNTATATPFGWLPSLAARMTEHQWRTVSFAAGVAVADMQCRTLVVALLKGLATDRS